MKKIFITIIAILLPVVTSADNWSYDEATHTLTISGKGSYYDGWHIPWSSYDIKSVIIESGMTSIPMNAFRGCSGLTITIPNTVTYIGEDAFMETYDISINITDLEAWCKIFFSHSAFSHYDGSDWENYYHRLFLNGEELTDLVIPDGVTSIGQCTFSNCTSITSVTIPNSVTSIGWRAFENCSGLTSVTIPNSVTTIGYNAFSGCSGLTSITIPNGVTSIGGYAFSGCSSLTSVTIPNSVTSIGSEAFYNCSGLTSVTISNSVTSIGRDAFSGTPWFTNQPNGLVYAGKVAYKYKGKMPINTSIIIKDGTVGIAGSAFSGCSGLTSVFIPNSVISIGESAFQKCSGLTFATIPNNVESIGYYAFSYCSGLISVIISSSVTSIDSGVFSYCSSLTSVTIPSSVESIGQDAFYNCSSLTSVTIPNSVTSIGQDAFYNCSGLTSVTIPSSVASIGQLTFYNCSGLTAIKVESGNQKYDSRNNCNAIIEKSTNTLIVGCKNTIIPNSVTSIGDGAFNGCSGLTSVTIPNNVTSIGERAFYSCSGLTSVTIPNSVTSIGGSAFSGCSGLTSVTIPNSVTSIDGSIFSDCSGLTSVTIPNSVTSVGWGAFRNCSGLTSVTIPSSVTSIGYEAFYNCSGLTSVTIPNSVTSIDSRAFYGCSGLKSIIIPNGVTSIGGYTFYGCSGLKSIIIGNNVTSIASVFPNCNNIQEAILSQTAYENGIPASVTKFTTYSKNPMRVEVVSKGVVSVTMKIYPIDDLGNTNENNFYTVTTSGQTPGQYIKWKLDDENYGIISEKTEGTLTLETQPAQPTSTTKARLIATVNEADDDQHYGFEWLRYDAPQEMPANKVSAPLYEGRIIGSLGGLNPDVYYKYRPFYKSDTGEVFYGEWIPFLTGDANVFFEPETHTKEAYGVTATGAQLTGVWIEGTEDIQEKGFEYWTVSGNKTRGVSSDVMTIVVSGNTMTATLEGLEGGTEYGYRSYVKTASGTKYGEDMTFKTPLLGDANNDGVVDVADIIEIVNTKAGHPSASFILNNADMDGDGNLTEADINAIVNIIMQR